MEKREHEMKGLLLQKEKEMELLHKKYQLDAEREDEILQKGI